MITELIKEAFNEGREQGGEWEDSDSFVVSQIYPHFDLDTAIIRQRLPNGQFGKTFNGIGEVEDYFEDEGITFRKSNFKNSIFTGFKCGGYKWEVVA